MEKILIVEDDELIAELERDFLEANGFETELALDGLEVERKAKTETFDAILLDVMLPGKTGFEICKELRRTMHLPIIMVTARKEDVDKIRGLGLGADDYLVKPFSPTELVARVKSHIHIHGLLLESKEEQAESSMYYGSLTILPKSRRVYVNGQEAVLVNKEFELLLFLAENPGIVFSKDTLFDRIWGMDSMGDTATVIVHVKRLRDKLEKASPEGRQYIETVWGAGYRFRVD